MSYELFKALHIIFVVTWFSGLFYIVRLFIYHVESSTGPSAELFHQQYSLMERRLWYGITWPSAILTLFFGGSLLQFYWPITDHKWLVAKLSMVFLLFLYHYSCGKIFHSLKERRCNLTSYQLRLWNEVATLFLVGIVFLVVFKSLLSFGMAILGLALFTLVLVGAIKFYKRLRNS